MSIGRMAVKAVVATTGVAALIGVGQAVAAGAGENLDSTYQGSVITWSHGTNGSVAVKDDYADSHSVYSLYDRRNNTGLRLDNSNGAGTTTYSGADTTNYVRKVQACLNVQLNPDRCGVADGPGDGR